MGPPSLEVAERIMRRQILGKRLFDAEIYRAQNQDLRHLRKADLVQHFHNHGYAERRLFGAVWETRDRISMRWLRGAGLEVGAGSTPMPLYGDATAAKADIDSSLSYGGTSADYVFALDELDIGAAAPPNCFDFVVCSHVVEHLDSLFRGIENALKLVRPGGVAYIAVPCKNFDQDGELIPDYGLDHHRRDYEEPGNSDAEHDAVILSQLRKAQQRGGTHDELGRDFRDWIKDNTLPPHTRYAWHRHSYNYQGWTSTILGALGYIKVSAQLVHSEFGSERMDANFVIERN
jgi:SAM-dependent methyltransferase